jgi:hypothetical protein
MGEEVLNLNLDEWIEYFNHDMDAVNTVYSLKRNTQYTDEEIIEAINKIENVAIQCNLNRMDIIGILFANEIKILK